MHDDEIEINATKISLNAGEISLRAKSDELISEINLSPEEIQISGDKISINGNTTFSNDVTIKGTLSGVDGDFSGTVTAEAGVLKNLSIAGKLTLSTGGSIVGDKLHIGSDGKITAQDVDIQGKFIIDEGEIGGWLINSEGLSHNNTLLSSSGFLRLGLGDDLIELNANHLTYRMWAGSPDPLLANFRVTKEGKLTAQDADIEGKITAGSGEISGWEINGNNLFKNNTTISSSGWIQLGEGETSLRLTTQHVSYRMWAGGETPDLATFKISNEGLLTATGAVIKGEIKADKGEVGGWFIGENTLKSREVGARIELNKQENRVSIFDSDGEKAAMGYLSGLPMNNPTTDKTHWGINDYGFYAKDGDKLVIDGDMEYDSGD